MGSHYPRAGNIGEEEEEVVLIPGRELDPLTAPAEPAPAEIPAREPVKIPG
jgi:hypothetical protein